MRSIWLPEDPTVPPLGTVHCCQPAARRCLLDDAGDLFQEGRAEAAKWPIRFEVESLVELDTVNSSRMIQHGKSRPARRHSIWLIDRNKRAASGSCEVMANKKMAPGTAGVRTTTQTGRALRPLSSPASACRYQR